MNRAEQCAIKFGKARHRPMIEITDADSAADYSWELMSGEIACRIFHNNARLFITHQICYIDIRDEFGGDPCLYY